MVLGSVAQANEAGKDALCSFCAKRDAKALEANESNTIKLEDIVNTIEEKLPVAN